MNPELARLLSELPAPDPADPARWVLALHGFLSAWIALEIPVLQPGASFADRLSSFARQLSLRGYGPSDLQVLRRIERENALAVAADAGRGALDPEEARAAAHDFLRLCTLCGIASPALDPVRAFRDGWTPSPVPLAAGAPLAEVRDEIRFAQPDTRRLLSQTTQWARDKQRLAELEGDAVRIRSAMERERAAATGPFPREAMMKRDLAENERLQESVRKKLEAYRDLDLYVQHVSRFSLYTRTRMDYERSVMKLTLEQSESLEAMRPGRDFLVRGGAGTGKTIVLLHALQRIRRDREAELSLRPGSRLLFLTYTNTLVKYDRYVAEILREPGTESLIGTADSFFQSRLRALGRAQRVDYAVAGQLAEKLNTTSFFSAPELALEIEEFLFGSLVTRQEYVGEMIARRGMRQPLSSAQRAAVWEIRDTMAGTMEHDGILSKNYARCLLIRHLEEHPEDPALRDIDVALVDESQDLSAADLRALRLMTQRGMLMAGDTGQSIYGVSSPYRRAGIDLAGRTKILHTSFRNTLPIQDVADAFRRLAGRDDDEGTGAVAFREGPMPELYTAATRDDLGRLLLRKAALFIERLGYDPENIAVLAPTKTDLAFLGDLLGHAGYLWANIRDDDFSFRQEKTIRLSTLHSSKGLDFAVVLLYLPALPPREDVEDAAAAALVRNLIYVAMTRAMDNLNVFTLEGAHEGQQEEPLQDLVRVLRSRA